MTIEVLRKVAELTDIGSIALVTIPLRPWIQEEIDAGHLIARVVKSGPLGIATGERFLTLSDIGREKLKGPNDQANSVAEGGVKVQRSVRAQQLRRKNYVDEF